MATAISVDPPTAGRRGWASRTAAAAGLSLALGAIAARDAEWIWPSHRPAIAVSSLTSLVAQATASTDERQRFEAIAGFDDMATLALRTLVSVRDEASASDLGQLAATSLETLTQGGQPLTQTWSDADPLQLVATIKDATAPRSIRSQATRRLGEVAAGCLATMRATRLTDAKLDADRKFLLGRLQDRLGASADAKR